MRRPVCQICRNKLRDNTYYWDAKNKILVHKVCKIVGEEIRDALVNPRPISVKASARR